MKYSKRKLVVIAMLAMVLLAGLLVGCAEKPAEPGDGNGQPVPTPPNGDGVGNGNGATDEDVVFEQGFYRPNEQNLPSEIAQWVEYSKEVEVVQEKEHEGYRYVLITQGMKPTGGYAVQVEEVVASGTELEIRMNIVEPQPGEMVTEALTYPYDLIIVEEEELPINFIDIAKEEEFQYYFGLHGIDEIDRPIVASSQWIKVFSPEPGEQVQGTMDLTGLANVFEGNVSFELTSATGEVVTTGYTTGSMGDWGYFEEQIQIPQGLAGELILELYSESAKDGSKMFVIEIPLVAAK